MKPTCDSAARWGAWTPWAVIVVIVVVVAVSMSPWLRSAGIPDFIHDWASPPVPHLIDGYASRAALPWRREGFGAPSAFIETSPAIALFEAVYRTFPIALAPKIFVALTLILFAFGSYALARVAHLSVPVSVAAALAALSTPFIFTEIVAGHQFALVGLALLPLVIRSAIRATKGSWGDASLFAIAVGASTLQVQYIGFDLIAVLATCIIRQTVTRQVIFGVAAGVVLCAPLLMSVVTGNDAIIASRANLAWEVGQSVPFIAGLRGSGYFTGYDAGTPYSLLVNNVSGALAALAVAAAVMVPRARPWAAAWLTCTLLAAGVVGPLGPLVGWLFAHVHAMSAFRELFNFVGPAQLCEAMALACGLAAIPGRGLRSVAVVAVSAFCVARLALWSALPQRIPSYTPPAATAEALERLRSDTSTARLLWLPLWPPLRPARVEASGNDPFDYPVGTHVVVNADAIAMPAAAAAWSVLGSRDPALFQTFGVGFIGVRKDWRSTTVGYARLAPPNVDPAAAEARLRQAGFTAFYTSPQVDLLRAPEPESLVALAREAWSPGLRAGTMADAVTPPCRNAAIRAVPWPIDSADPRLAFVPAAYWSWYAPNLTDAERAVFTLGPASLPVAASYALLGNLHGPSDWRWAAISGSGSVRGPGIVAALATGSCGAVERPRIAVAQDASPLTVRAESALRFRFTIPPSTGARLIVLHERFDERWQLWLDGTPVAEHAIVEGSLNGWRIPPSARPRTGTIVFRGAAAASAIAAAMRVLYVALALIVIGFSLRVTV